MTPQSPTPTGRANGAPGRTMPTTPRRVRGGIRLSREVEELRGDARAARWLTIAETIGGPNTFSLGLAYATSGQTLSLDCSPGTIDAQVQGARRTPYRVTIPFRVWSDDEWRLAIEAIRREPAIFADLLAGNVTAAACSALERSGIALLPNLNETSDARCECARATRCKHIATVLILMTERAIDDSTAITMLRGLALGDVVDRAQQERGIEARGAVAAHPEPRLSAAALTAPPLEETIESFWSSPVDATSRASESGPNHTPHHISHALLRRLGPSPLQGKFPIVGLLASIYDAVSQRARSMIEE